MNCAAKGCPELVDDPDAGQVFCPSCWSALDPDDQDAVSDAYGTRSFRKEIRRAIEALTRRLA